MDREAITGAELRDFYENHWPGKPGEVWHEDCEYTLTDDHGNFTFPLDGRLELSGMGYLQHGWNGPAQSFEEAWREHVQCCAGSEVLVLRVPVEGIEDLRSHVVRLGGTFLFEEGCEQGPANQP